MKSENLTTSGRNSSTALLSTATASAAVTGALFSLQSHADAAIVYSGVLDTTISVAGAVDSVATHQVRLSAAAGLTMTLARRLSVNPAHASVRLEGAEVVLLKNASGQLLKLASGAAVTAGKFAGHSGDVASLARYQAGALIKGTWAEGQTGFAAFKMEASGDYGWVRLEYTSADHTPYPSGFEVLSWGYNNTSGAAIAAGQTTATPEPSSMALLALAGAGAAFVRRKRQTA